MRFGASRSLSSEKLALFGDGCPATDARPLRLDPGLDPRHVGAKEKPTRSRHTSKPRTLDGTSTFHRSSMWKKTQQLGVHLHFDGVEGIASELGFSCYELPMPPEVSFVMLTLLRKPYPSFFGCMRAHIGRQQVGAGVGREIGPPPLDDQSTAMLLKLVCAFQMCGRWMGAGTCAVRRSVLVQPNSSPHHLVRDGT